MIETKTTTGTRPGTRRTPRLRAAWLAIALVGGAAGGCLAYVPPRDEPRHRAIDWRPSFEAARADAEASGRPLLVVAVAGERDGRC